MLEELKKVDNFLAQIERLKQRSNLLEEIMSYYNNETMTFDIPEKWKNANRISPDKLPAESPRHLLNNRIKEKLTTDELYGFQIYD